MIKEFYSTIYIEIKYHPIKDHVQKGNDVLEFVKYINGLTSPQNLYKRIVSAQFVEN
jgi:hypothetical protein